MPAIPWFLKIIVTIVVEKVAALILAKQKFAARRRIRREQKEIRRGQNPPQSR